MNQKIQVKFYPLTSEITTMLRKGKLTAAEWRIWSYLVEVDPWGDRYQDLDSLVVMSKCDCSRATFYRAIAKFQKLGLFDIQDKGFSIRNLTGASKLTSADEKIGDKKLRKGNLKNETDETKVVSKMRLNSQNCENDLKNETEFSKMRLNSQICENRPPKAPLDIASELSQTIQTYTDFKQTLSESERENFLKFVEKKIHNLEKPINDLEAWLASQTKAKQNRWEVYYQSYQEEGRKITRKNSKSSSKSRKEKKLAIENWQEHLKQQEEVYKQQEDLIKKDLELKSRAKQESKTTTNLSTGIPDPWAEVQLSYDIDITYPDNDIDGYINSADNELDSAHSDCHSTDGEVNSADNSGGESLSQESEEDLKQQIDRILNGFSRVDRDAPNIPSEKPDPNLSQKVNEGLQYLRGMEVTKYESEADEMGGEEE